MTAWYVLIRDSLQLVNIRVFVWCPMVMKATEKKKLHSAVGNVHCLVNSILAGILFLKLQWFPCQCHFWYLPSLSSLWLITPGIVGTAIGYHDLKTLLPYIIRKNTFRQNNFLRFLFIRIWNFKDLKICHLNRD